MAKPAQSSFHRILLSRILLLSIPVLLTGELVAYQKVRSTLLATARQNLTESAVRKGENIQDLTEASRSTLVAASNAFANLQEVVPGSSEAQALVQQAKRWLPLEVECLQITQLQTQESIARTCDRAIFPVAGSDRRLTGLNPGFGVQISPVLQPVAVQNRSSRQLELVFSAPIPASPGSAGYALSMQLAVQRQEQSPPGSLSGYTVVIDQDGTVLSHPDPSRVGRNIQEGTDAKQLQELVANAIAGRQDFLRLLPAYQQQESLVGYSPIQVALTPEQRRTWVILAVAPVENALAGLEDIKQVLFMLTMGLLAANLLAAYYLSRDLARPIEQLRDQALNLDQSPDRAPRNPKNFKIKELSQLSTALDNMVERLEERAEELEAAWQEAQVANQLKSEFLATTSHELRTPLNAIIGCVRLVRDDCCDGREEELEFLQQADDAAIHLLKIINDLLDIAKIEAGKVEMLLQPVAIQDLCQQCLSMVQPAAEKKHLALSIDVNPDLERVPLDERRVRQMVINLLSNAIKFTPEGGQVKLAARWGLGEQLEQDVRPDRSPINPATPYLCLEVIDSGIGIPPERWHLLFRPFQQIDSSSTRKHEGTGLGLALTKRLAELHGGTVSFQSTPGQGSVFRIWLPSPDATVTIAPDPDAAPEQPLPIAIDSRGNS